MLMFPHFEKVTGNSTVSHFLLMLGYKLFSFYFPLFLLEKGLSLPRVGFVYLLIYLPMVISSLLMGAISRKINPFFLIISGILGYGLYSLGMLFLPLSMFFYVLQVILGISASFFFVGNKVIFMSSHLNNLTRSFGWFRSGAYYAAAIAPVIGAAVIFLWGFSGVFILSILIHFINIIFTFSSMPKHLNTQLSGYSHSISLGNFYQLIRKSFSVTVVPILVFSLLILILGGFYQSFFLIFLKSIGWGRTEILAYSSLFSVLFLPLSLYGVKIFSDSGVIELIFIGGIIFAVASMLIGFTASLVGFAGIIVLMEIGEFGSFISGSSRSGFIARVFSSFPHGAAALDTVFSPLGIALGALFGGLFVGYIGYPGIFISGGILILFSAFFVKFPPLTSENKV